MKELLQKLMTMFKTKNIELSPDEIADINESVLKSLTPAPPTNQQYKIDMPDVSHNAKIFQDAINHMNAQIEANTKKFEETITALNKQNEDLLKALGDERTQREAGIKALEDKAKAEKSDKIKAKITEMKTDGRLPAQNTELESKYLAMFESDFDNAVAIVDSIPKTINVTGKPAGAINGDNHDGKTFVKPMTPLGSMLTPETISRYANTPLVQQIN